MDDVVVQNGRHTINVLDHSGHMKMEWDPEVPAEVEAARDLFEEKTEAGYRAFRVRNGEQSTRMDSFDAGAREMMLVPQLRGG